MDSLYVPYSGDIPAAIEINGHRVLIVSSCEEDLVRDLGMVGGNELREEFVSDLDPSELLADLAEKIQGGVVVAPPGISLSVMVHNLEQELPWIH